jgi:glutamyl-Q tRNA(Asp) synthetase
MESDEPVLRQSERSAAYDNALQQLHASGRSYYCNCTRAQRAAQAPSPSGPPFHPDAYPGTCRDRAAHPPAAVRFRVPPGEVAVLDRACGWYRQDVEHAVGDPVIFRADGYWAYQLAVVVDDAHQGITDIVRGADLLDNTPRQILLQQALGLPQPRYLHVPLVRDAQGRKLSKQAGDQALAAGSTAQALATLEQAWGHLGNPPTGAQGLAQFQMRAIAAWRRRWAQDGARRRATPAAATPADSGSAAACARDA